MADIVHFGMKSKVMGGSRVFRLKSLAAARRSRQPRIHWAAIFAKALAISARRWPQLRQCYIPYPWPHIYEHPESVVAVVIERDWRGEHAVFFDQMIAPDRLPLADLDPKIRGLKTTPIEQVGGYRRIIRFARLPLLVRRLIWHLTLYCSGRVRSRYLGTVSLNSLPARDARVLQSTTPLTLSIFFGPLEPNGDMRIYAFFDHRVIDGMEIYRLFRDLEDTLNNEIAHELRELADTERARSHPKCNEGDASRSIVLTGS
jgi:hypothetical protein